MVDDPLVTHDDVARTLPPTIRSDFLPPEEQDWAFVCGYHPNGAYLVPYAELKALRRYSP